MSIVTRTSLCLILVIASLGARPSAHAAGNIMLVLAPHCAEVDRTMCFDYQIVNGNTIKTNPLATGDILDIDILVRGADFARVRSVRSWLSYNPAILEARSVELTTALTSPTPGEQTIDAATGEVKIGGSTAGFSTPDTAIARVTFRVLSTTEDTEISFVDYQMNGTGKTAVNENTSTPLLSAEPATLNVTLASRSAVSSSQSSPGSEQSSARFPVTETSSSTSSVSSFSSSSVAGEASTFGILQVQDLRVTTRDSMVFVGWRELRSSELAGYNVYYGTVSGRYIQRRSVPSTSSSLVLRDLESGTTYFVAIRAVNTRDQESVFSQEVSVTVGQPETATAPLTNLPSDITAPPRNPVSTNGNGTITGETGTASTVMLLLLGSAVIGTFFAFKRQISLHTSPAHG